ncbi:MAG: hypothetical protein P8H23_03320 [Flavobacteriaceae bacterium]|jgi:hypothetical protein|nr:hypothetical protein [Flavobacteriaceae bacterium]
MQFLYFDPGLGAMIVQAIVAAVAGVLLFTKNIVYKLKIIFGIIDKENKTDSIDIDDNNSASNDD